MRLMYNKLINWFNHRFFTSRITNISTTDDKPEEPKIDKGILLTQGGLFEYIGNNRYNGLYEVTYLDLATSGGGGGIAEARRISDGLLITVYCDNDGYYNGPSPIYNVGIFKPVKEIKQFKLC